MHDPLTYYLVLLTAYYRSPADSVLCGLALALGAKPRRRCIASDAATSVKTPPALHATTAATLCCSSQRVCPGRRKEPVTALRARLLPEPEAPTTAATRHAPRFCSSTSSRGMTYCVGQARRESTLLVSSLELEPQNQLALQTARQPLICATAEHLDPSASHDPQSRRVALPRERVSHMLLPPRHLASLHGGAINRNARRDRSRTHARVSVGLQHRAANDGGAVTASAREHLHSTS